MIRYKKLYPIFGIVVMAFGASIPFAVAKNLPTRSKNGLKNNQAVSTPTGSGRQLRIDGPSRMLAADTVAITAVRNLQSENWVQDLEIEVKNTSNKPIYFLLITLTFPDIPLSTEADGTPRGTILLLKYGNWELAKLEQRPTPEDLPLQPGESYVFKYSEPFWSGLRSSLIRKNIPQSTIKIINLRIDSLSFGDGTGVKAGHKHSLAVNQK